MKKRHTYHGFLKKYKYVYYFIGILVSFGIVSGLLFSSFIDVNDIQQLSSFLTMIDEGVDAYTYFVNSFFSSVILIVFLFFLGTSIVGVPLISFFAFSKGLQIGFSCALFVYTYKLKGIVGILLTLLPQIVFDSIAIFLISAASIQMSIYILYSTTNKERLDFKKLGNSILNDLCICFFIALIGAYLKSTLVIEFIKLFNLM